PRRSARTHGPVPTSAALRGGGADAGRGPDRRKLHGFVPPPGEYCAACGSAAPRHSSRAELLGHKQARTTGKVLRLALGDLDALPALLADNATSAAAIVAAL